jgi:DNA-binding transcriptional MerR regulator
VTLPIGELSARTGATVRMLRYYEEQGLLSPRRTPAGYRMYDETDILRVGRIRCMLASALPTSVVAQALRFLVDEPAVPSTQDERARLAGVLEQELATLTERIAILEGSRQQLATFLDDVRTAAVGPENPGDPPGPSVGPAVRQSGPMARTASRSASRNEVRAARIDGPHAPATS